MHPIDPVVFVFGATGYVGAAVVEAAARVEHVARIVAHARPGSAHADALAGRVAALSETLPGAPPAVEIDRTPLEPGPMAETLRRLAPTHIFLCHGTTAKRARREGLTDPYGVVDAGLTGLVTDAARSIATPPRVIYLSSIGTTSRARGSYLRARWQAEEHVRGSALPYTICRAALISGADRGESRALENVARRVLDPLLSALGTIGLGRLRDRYSSMDAAEVAEGLVRSGFHYMTINRVVESDELRRVGVYERETWAPRSRRDTPRH